MTLTEITPVILTYNEEPNIVRCLECLTWARTVIVVDSGSTDQTEILARKFTNVRWLVRPFDNHTAQWNYGVDAAETPWVLSLDADYRISKLFEQEVTSLRDQQTVAYFCRFRYCVHGRPLRSGVYPPRAVLFRRERCRYVPDGHTQRLEINGSTAFLASTWDHDDRKSLDRWLLNQLKYATLEADKLLSLAPESRTGRDRLRLTGLASPFVMFAYCMIWRRGIFDGWAGWCYAAERTFAELLLALHVIHARLERVPKV